MNRRDLLAGMPAALIGGATATGAFAVGAEVGKTQERDLAIHLPKDAAVGSVLMLLKVASGWIVVPSQKPCTQVKWGARWIRVDPKTLIGRA